MYIHKKISHENTWPILIKLVHCICVDRHALLYIFLAASTSFLQHPRSSEQIRNVTSKHKITEVTSSKRKHFTHHLNSQCLWIWVLREAHHLLISFRYTLKQLWTKSVQKCHFTSFLSKRPFMLQFNEQNNTNCHS